MVFLFVVTDFNMGGITTSLKNLSDELIRHGHKVSILNLPGVHKFPVEFNPDVKFIQLHGRATKWSLGILDFQKAKGIRKLSLLLFGLLKKSLSRMKIWNSFIFGSVPMIQCDVAIAYRQSNECYYLIKHKTTAKRTVAFIHSEFDGDCSSWIGPLDGIDRIACVSDDWSTKFRKTFPHLAKKVGTVYNLFDAKLIQQKAKEFETLYESEIFNIVTVARIENLQKRIDTIPEIYSRIQSRSKRKIKWYIVGDGKDRYLVNEAIQKYHCEGNVILLGAQDNPYPYIQNADLFVLTSSWESYGMVLMEALILGVPVVAGEYGALREIIQHPLEGVIAENSVQGISEGILSLINDEEKYNAMKQYLGNYEYNPEAVYEQFMNLCK